MSRRDRRRPVSLRATGVEAQFRPVNPTRARPASPPAASSSRTVHLALLPLRFFVGGTFVYAGLDKLIDPRFLQATGPGSIGEQLLGFTHSSPLAGLVSVFALPFPVALGLLMALAEIAIGLGALTGLLYRTSAAAGAAVSLLFFLTASWTVRPYYYGPDLPYAAGWLTLALAGHGGVAVLPVPLAALLAPDGDPEDAAPGRRAFLQGGILAAVAVVVAGLGGMWGALFRGPDTGTAVRGASSDPGVGAAGATPTPPAAAGSSPAASAAPPAANQLATLTSLQPRSALPFVDPTTGDPAVLIRLADGQVVAFDAVCTHAGCTVEYDPPSGLLGCPCHGAVFDPSHNAAVVQGPAPVALAALPIVVNKTTGAITLGG
ncbi:MAG TPA: Rieske 2Fe-2S domain-containing protein [Verrucomicrobiae bacterium]|nr:Rieske 2Fe-2S domain-containing protein [Verrucomicrobiae bacterium]